MATITLTSHDAWLAERKNGLGASDVAAALGVNPWKSQFALWAEKCGLLPDEDLALENEAVEWGNRLEGAVGQAFADRTGRKVEHQGKFEMHVHPDLPFLRASLDFLQWQELLPGHYGDDGALETKTTSAFNADDWKGGAVPLYYQVQLQTQLAVCGLSWGSIAVLIGGQRLLHADLDRDDDFIASMLPHLESFWRHVVDRTPPAVDASPATAKVLHKLHPDDNGCTVELPDEAEEWADSLESIKDEIKRLEELKTLHENKLKFAIGDNTFGQLPKGARFSFKTQTRAEHVVRASTFRVLRRLKG